MTAWIVLDVSPSMAFGTGLRLKSDVAAGAAALLARLAVRRGGRAGLVLCGGRHELLIAPARGSPRVGRHRARRWRGRGRRRSRRRRQPRPRPRPAEPPGALARDGGRRVGLPGRGWLGPTAARARRAPLACGRRRERPASRQGLPSAGVLRLVDPESGRQIEADTRDAALRERYAERERERRSAVRDELRDGRRRGRGADHRRSLARTARTEVAMSFASPLLLLSIAALPLLAAAYAWLRRRPGRYSARFPGVPVLAGAVAATPLWRAPHSRHGGRPRAGRARGGARAPARDRRRAGGARQRRARDGRLSLHARERRRAEPDGRSARRGGVIPRRRARRAARGRRRLLDDAQLGRGAEPGQGTCSCASGEPPARTEAPPPAMPSPRRFSCSRTQDKRRPPAAVVLLSDGKTTTGRDPVEVARQARAAGVPINTVALGTSGGTITDSNGNTLPVPPDPETMVEIAKHLRRRELRRGRRRPAGCGLRAPRVADRDAPRAARDHRRLRRRRHGPAACRRRALAESRRKASMKGDLEMTEPGTTLERRERLARRARLGGAEGPARSAAGARGRARSPRPRTDGGARPRRAARGRLRAGAVGALAAALLVGGGVVVGDLTGSDSASATGCRGAAARGRRAARRRVRTRAASTPRWPTAWWRSR